MKLILSAAAARLARGADFCVPAACRKLAPGADGFMKDLVGDLECCAPRERAGCAAGYRYATRGRCTSGPCEEYATCCVHCVDGEPCARVDAARFGQTARRDCGNDDANYIRVWIVMAVMCFVASIGLLVCLFAQYHRSEQQRRLQVARGKRDTHAPARKFSLAVVELLPPDLERGATPRIQARQLDENVGETRGPSVWDPDGDPRGAYAVPACPQCLTPCRCAPKACSEQDPCHAIGGHVAAPEAESMAREEELSRSAPPDGDLEAATQAACPMSCSRRTAAASSSCRPLRPIGATVARQIPVLKVTRSNRVSVTGFFDEPAADRYTHRHGFHKLMKAVRVDEDRPPIFLPAGPDGPPASITTM